MSTHFPSLHEKSQQKKKKKNQKMAASTFPLPLGGTFVISLTYINFPKTHRDGLGIYRSLSLSFSLSLVASLRFSPPKPHLFPKRSLCFPRVRVSQGRVFSSPTMFLKTPFHISKLSIANLQHRCWSTMA